MDDRDERLNALNDPARHAAHLARMDAVQTRLTALNDPVRHTEQMARLDATIAQLDATHARLKAMHAHAKTFPSLPELALALDALTAEVGRLREHLEVVEAECQALRQRELLRFWDDDEAEGGDTEEKD